MFPIVDYLQQLMTQTITVHIYSTPNFAFETILNVLICLIHCLLIKEVHRTIKKTNIPPIKVQGSGKDYGMKALSEYGGVIKSHPELGVEVMFKDNSLIKNDWDTLTKINKMLSTSISEYIRHEVKLNDDIPEVDEQEKPEDGDKVIEPKEHDSLDTISHFLMKDLPDLQHPVQQQNQNTATSQR